MEEWGASNGPPFLPARYPRAILPLPHAAPQAGARFRHFGERVGVAGAGLGGEPLFEVLDRAVEVDERSGVFAERAAMTVSAAQMMTAGDGFTRCPPAMAMAIGAMHAWQRDVTSALSPSAAGILMASTAQQAKTTGPAFTCSRCAVGRRDSPRATVTPSASMARTGFC